MLLVRESAGVDGYDLCATSSYVIPSRGKDTIETGLVVSLPLGTCAWIAPRLAIKNFIDVGTRVTNSNYQGKTKVVLLNHFAKDFMI